MTPRLESHPVHKTSYALAVAIGLLALAGGAAQGANTAAEVCQRWACDRADLSEGTSTANITTCDPGDLLPPGRPNALKLVNLYRYLAGMPAVTEDPTFDVNAQDCAIIQAANGLSHTPATTATCYNATGATASNRSSICSGQAVGCIDLYMNDANGGLGFGHRTWIFANSLGPVGFGSVGTGRGMTASCFYQVGGTGKAGAAFVAWPPPGPVPLAAITATGVDKAGWSIQSDSINMATATATVTDGTTNQPVTVTPGLPSYGAKYAMGILATGWTSQAGHDYTVTVGGTTMPITYTIQVVDCAGTTTSACSGGGTGGTGGPGGTSGGGAGGRGGSSGVAGTSGRGGASGVAGTSGTAGTSATAGTSGSGPGGAAGSAPSGAAGTGTGTGSAGQTGTPSPATGSGCACDVSGRLARLAWPLAIALALIVSMLRRRRRS